MVVGLKLDRLDDARGLDPEIDALLDARGSKPPGALAAGRPLSNRYRRDG